MKEKVFAGARSRPGGNTGEQPAACERGCYAAAGTADLAPAVPPLLTFEFGFVGETGTVPS